MSSALITTTLSLFQPTLPLSLFFLSGKPKNLTLSMSSPDNRLNHPKA